VPIVTYSMLDREADICLDKAETSIFETSVLINTPLDTRLRIVTPLLGKANLYNILAAVATGIATGASLKTIVNGIEAVEVVPGRCESIDEGQDFAVVVDHARAPEAFSRLLDCMRDCKPARIITVFGCCGGEEKVMRSYMGEIAHYKSDIVILTNDNPRGESPEKIINDIVIGWPDDVLLRHSWFIYPWYQDVCRLPLWYTDQALWAQSEVRRYIIEDRYLAIRSAIYTAQKNDMVIVAGKGHEDYQEWIGSHVYSGHEDEVKKNPTILKQLVKGWFDDRVECRTALLKIPQLNALLPGLDRSVLPWMWPGLQRKHPLEEWDNEGLVTKVGAQPATIRQEA